MIAEMETQAVRTEEMLAETEKHAKTLLTRIQAMRKRAASGEFSPLPALFEQLPQQAANVLASAQAARDGLMYDTAAALSDGSYLAELKAEANKQGVTLVERDGRLSAFPLLIKLDARAAGIRIGRALEKRLRPSTVIRLIAKAQAVSRFDATRFLNQIFSAYSYLARLAQPAWQPKKPGIGPAILLDEIYAMLTLLPAAGADYPRTAFACDLLRLDRSPDARTTAGHSFTLPASTGSKGSHRLTVFDEDGIERIFVAVQFSLGAGP